ncbi:ran-binding protein 9-like isoform X3 [Moschus berezovskii]|uniref:ran-binding protein 9-like isoform X3 n=1 Tax=Moschus berezovskii TaxID=68408 RepID=UPI002443C8D9|nr:ran-binding protein 9-like isoform X3 [Moschus berezovskii]
MKPGGGERGGGGGGGGAAGAGMRPEPRCSLTRAGPETPPLPRPPPPPTWFQRCAQAGPAGGRAGGRPGGARGVYLTKPTASAKLPDGKEDLAANHRGVPFKLQICLSSLDSCLLLPCCFGGVRHPSGHRECWWTSLPAPRSSVEVHGTWCLGHSKYI